jgi:hypothetical protein
MDTIFGYVTYIYDDDTVMVHITDQKSISGYKYSDDEKITISDWKSLNNYKGVYDIRISLIYNLLHRKVQVDVIGLNKINGLNGKMTILSDSARIAS